ALEYGRTNEPNAVRTYAKLKPSVRIQECGLFVCTDLPFLCTSPDRLLDGNGLLEVKCPFTARLYETLAETSKHHSIGIRICKKNKCLYLPKTNKYYFQVQGQLNITQRDYCDLMFWSPTDKFVQRITRDTNFWKRLTPKLQDFYFGYLLP
ncbi:unnamed protein product, partial [Ixodes pacificus]